MILRVLDVTVPGYSAKLFKNEAFKWPRIIDFVLILQRFSGGLIFMFDFCVGTRFALNR